MAEDSDEAESIEDYLASPEKQLRFNVRNCLQAGQSPESLRAEIADMFARRIDRAANDTDRDALKRDRFKYRQTVANAIREWRADQKTNHSPMAI